MNERIIVDGAIQVELIGASFRRVNICNYSEINQLCLNLQRDSNPGNDEPHFLTPSEAKNLIEELSKGLKILGEFSE